MSNFELAVQDAAKAYRLELGRWQAEQPVRRGPKLSVAVRVAKFEATERGSAARAVLDRAREAKAAAAVLGALAGEATR